MSSIMVGSSYGESHVRLLFAIRPRPETESGGASAATTAAQLRSAVFRDITCGIDLTGDFARAFVSGDNTPLIPTDSIRAVVVRVIKQAMGVGDSPGGHVRQNQRKENGSHHRASNVCPHASGTAGPPLEVLASLVATQIVDLYAQVTATTVTLSEPAQLPRVDAQRIVAAACFIHPGPSAERRTATAVLRRGHPLVLRSGVSRLHLVRMLPCALRGFHRDDALPPLAETDDVGLVDAILDIEAEYFPGAMAQAATPRPGAAAAAAPSQAGPLVLQHFGDAYSAIRASAIDAFAAHYPSTSIQQTLLVTAKEALAAADQVKEIRAAAHFVIHRRAKLPGEGVPHSGAIAMEMFPVAQPVEGACPTSRAVARAHVKRTHVAIPNPFTWGPTFECGEAMIDAQHSAMFDLIRALDSDRTNRKLVDEILAHATQHFRDEEKIVAASGYSKLKQTSHARIHEKFLKRAQDATAGFGSKSKPVTDELILFLKKWLVEHIAGADMQFAEFLKAKREKEKARDKSSKGETGSEESRRRQPVPPAASSPQSSSFDLLLSRL